MSLTAFQPFYFYSGDARFVLRPVVKSDREGLRTFARDNESDLRDSFPATISALNGKRSDAASWLNHKLENIKNRKGIFCVIENLESKRIVGFISAFQFEWRTPKCELSWIVENALQRRGIAFQCGSYMVEFLTAKMGLMKVLCRISPANEPSIQLALKLGFVKEGLHLRDFRDGNDNLLDVLYFGLFA